MLKEEDIIIIDKELFKKIKLKLDGLIFWREKNNKIEIKPVNKQISKLIKELMEYNG